MIKRILIDAFALAVATWVLPGITLGADPWSVKGILTLLGVAVVFGVVNAVVKPLFKALTGCIVMITFGLFLLVINGVLMYFVSWLCGWVNLGWNVDGWLSAFEGGIIVAVISFLAAKLLKDRK